MTDLEKILLNALKQADIYLNNYDTSAPSRIKAECRAAVEAAIGTAKQVSMETELRLALTTAINRLKPVQTEHDPRICGQCAEEACR